MSGEEQRMSKDTRPESAPEQAGPSIPSEVPVVPVRDVVVHPYMVVPLFVSRQMSIRAVDASLANRRFILIIAQRDREVEDPKPEDIYEVGTVCLVIRMLKLPDSRVRLWAQGDLWGAVQMFTKLLVVEPAGADAYSSRGRLFWQLGQDKLAMADFDQAIALSEDADTFVFRAIVLHQRSQNRQALRDVDRAIRLAPHLASAYTVRGAIYEDMDRADEAHRLRCRVP